MSDELAEAVAFWRNQDRETVLQFGGWQGHAVRLAIAYIDLIDRLESERIERKKPADLEWLKTIPGSTWSQHIGCWGIEDDAIGKVLEFFVVDDSWWLYGAKMFREQLTPVTRGQILDLVRILVGEQIP